MGDEGEEEEALAMMMMMMKNMRTGKGGVVYAYLVLVP